MATERIGQKPANTGGHPGRPSHHPSRFQVITSPAIGKSGCFDVTLIKTATPGQAFKQTNEIVRSWRGRASLKGSHGSPLDMALQEAHEMRRSLDASLWDLKRSG